MSKQDNLISVDKLLKWLENVIKENQEPLNEYRIERAIAYEDLTMKLKSENHSFYPDPVPTIKPGDTVNHYGYQFPFLLGVKVDHLQIHRFGTYAVLEHEGETYTVPLDSLEVVKDE